MSTLATMTVELDMDTNRVAAGAAQAADSIRTIDEVTDTVTRDANGRLRDARGRFVSMGQSAAAASSQVAEGAEAATQAIERVAEATQETTRRTQAASQAFIRTDVAFNSFTRDAAGRLRDVNGRLATMRQQAEVSAESVVSSGERAADGIREIGDETDSVSSRLRGKLTKALTVLGKAVAAVGVGIPALAATAAAAGGLAAAFASAGVAVGAFKLAAQPQLTAVASASQLAQKAADAHDTAIRKQAEAQALAAKGGKAYKQALTSAASASRTAKDADAAMAQQLKGLPPATQATAKAFGGLKSDYQKWSDALASSTMPVFTKGIQILRSLLPSLTPLVKAAAKAFSDFLGSLQGNKGDIAGFFQKLANAATKNLPNFLNSLKNVAVGVAGIVGAFMGMSGDMSGGVEKATEKFAKFGQGLSKSQGFADFIKMAKNGGSELATLAKAAVKLLVALGPLVGITAKLATKLADVISAVPPSVLSLIASAITVIVAGMKLWAAYSAVAATATDLWAAATWLMNSALFANPITWIVLAIVALIAIIVLIATKTTWFQTAWSTAWNAIKGVAALVVTGVMTMLGWFASLPGKFKQWFDAAAAAVATALAKAIAFVAGVPGKIWNALSSLASTLLGIASRAGTSFVNSVKSKFNAAISFIKGIPGKARSAVGSLGGILSSAGKSLINGFINGIESAFGRVRSTLHSLTSMLPSWKGPPATDATILAGNGALVMQGFMDGVASKVPALRKQLGDITQDMTSMAVGVTPSGVLRTSNQNNQSLTLNVDGTDQDMKRLIRRMVRTDGRGNVQTAFGR